MVKVSFSNPASSEVDEYLELQQLKLFTFQLRLNLSVCKEKHERTSQHNAIKTIVGSQHMEMLRENVQNGFLNFFLLLFVK